MTITQVMGRGFQTRHESGDSAKLAYMAGDSARRFLLLQWVAEARKLNLRTAHRRWCRRNGVSFR